MSDEAEQCQARSEPEVTRLREQLALLEDLGPDTDAALFDQRIEISERLNAAQARELSCRQIADSSAALTTEITGVLEDLTAATLWRRGPSLPQLLMTVADEVRGWPARVRGKLQPQLLPGLLVGQLFAILVVAGIAAIGIGVYLRVRYRAWYKNKGYDTKQAGLSVLVPKPFFTNAPPLLLGATLSIVLFVTTSNASLVQPVVRVSAAMFFYGLACVAIDWITGKLSPSAQVAGFYPDHVAPM
ncbi:MAG: hypothetical protein AAGF46_11625, partial [Pseudomonadota bacterium]